MKKSSVEGSRDYSAFPCVKIKIFVNSLTLFFLTLTDFFWFLLTSWQFWIFEISNLRYTDRQTDNNRCVFSKNENALKILNLFVCFKLFLIIKKLFIPKMNENNFYDFWKKLSKKKLVFQPHSNLKNGGRHMEMSGK